MTIIYHNDNLFHNVISWRSVAGVIYVLNKTAIDWHDKNHFTFETVACSSEHSSARTCVELILDLRISLRCLCVPIHKLSCIFGDNYSTVNNIMTPQGKIHERHVALSFHRVREDVSAKIIS